MSFSNDAKKLLIVEAKAGKQLNIFTWTLEDGVWSLSYDSTAVSILCEAQYGADLFAGGSDGNIYVRHAGSWALSYNSSSPAINALYVWNGYLWAGGDGVPTPNWANVGDELVFKYDGASWAVAYSTPATFSGDSLNTSHQQHVRGFASVGT